MYLFLTLFSSQDTPATPCTVINFNSMSCLTPRLISAGKSRRLVATAENISYTVVVDNAAGPDFSNPLLQLNVLPDPVIGDLSDVVASNVIGINVSQRLVHVHYKSLIVCCLFFSFLSLRAPT